VTTESLARYLELVRVSSKGQVDNDTPEAQRQALYELREKRPGILVERIEALAVSATLPFHETEAGRRLVWHVKHRTFDELRCVSMSRIPGMRSKDPVERAWGLKLLIDAGAIAVDTSGRIERPKADPHTQIAFQVQALIAAQYAEDLKESTKRGREKVARKNGQPAGPPPYGRRYNKAKNEWSLDPDECAVIHRFLDAIIGGAAMTATAKALNADQIPSPRGVKWSVPTIKRMIKTDVLLGKGRYAGIEYETLPVVTRTKLEAARRALAQKSPVRPPKKRTVEALCVGRIFCDVKECGHKMYVKQGSTGRYFYRCASTHTDNRVAGEELHADAWKQHPVQPVDAAVWEEIYGALSAPEVLQHVLVSDENKADWEAQAARCEALLTRQAKERDRLVRDRRRGLLTDDDVNRQLMEMKSEREILEATLATARDRLAVLELERAQGDQLTEQLTRFAARIGEAKPKDRRAIFESIIPQQPRRPRGTPRTQSLTGFGVFVDNQGYMRIRYGVPGGRVPQSNEGAESVGANVETRS